MLLQNLKLKAIIDLSETEKSKGDENVFKNNDVIYVGKAKKLKKSNQKIK